MPKSIHYLNGQEAALKKLGYYSTGNPDWDQFHRDYRDRARDQRDRERAQREEKEHRARAFAGKALQRPEDFENLKSQLTEQEIADARMQSGVTGGLLGGTLGAFGGGGLAAALRPRSGGLQLAGMLGGAALGGYGGYKLMEPMGEGIGRSNAEDLIDLAHTHGLHNLQRPNSSQG
jgi:hypothetical protein